jgi:hypothetical protein
MVTPRTSTFAQPKVPRKEYTASLLRKAHRGHAGGKTVDCPSAACAKVEQNFLRISSPSMPQKEVAFRKIVRFYNSALRLLNGIKPPCK